MDKRRRDRKKRIRREIFARDDFTCRDCGWVADITDWDGVSPLTDGTRMLTIDHIVERAAGGRSTKENFATLCNFCNTAKSLDFSREIQIGMKRGLTLDQARRRAAQLKGYPVETFQVAPEDVKDGSASGE